jgi:hypothetical protein
MRATAINVGSLVKTGKGVFGVISKFNRKDKLYTISWANGMRQGENIIYDKKMVDYLLAEGGWKYFPSGGKL